MAGAVIGLPSLALLVLARLELGSSFSVRPKAQTLVTHGLYSRIRNPIYVFGGLVFAGAFFTSTSRALYGSLSYSFRCRFIEHGRKKRSFRQDSVTNTSNINRAHGSNKLNGAADVPEMFVPTSPVSAAFALRSERDDVACDLRPPSLFYLSFSILDAYGTVWLLPGCETWLSRRQDCFWKACPRTFGYRVARDVFELVIVAYA